MNYTRSLTANALSNQSAAQILRTLNGKVTITAPRTAVVGLYRTSYAAAQCKHFSVSKPLIVREMFPAPETPAIRKSEPAWPHPVYTREQMEAVKVAHRQTKDFGDWVALGMVRVLRTFLDLVSGYRHDPDVATGKKDAKDALAHRGMTERKWLIRLVFLESVAGCPGMVGGMLRHLHSMRRLKRDNGWIETLLEESYNERMHLLTFLKMIEPGWFMRLAVLGAQGAFFNALFVSYLMAPRTVHRFVGYLEEEAVLTYTRLLADIDAGRQPKFEKMQAPDIAVQYWNMPEGHRTMRDLILYVRADEAKHREVNHTLANLKQKEDPNPYTSQYKDESKPHPTKDISVQRSTGWEREEVI